MNADKKHKRHIWTALPARSKNENKIPQDLRRHHIERDLGPAVDLPPRDHNCLILLSLFINSLKKQERLG